MGRHPTRPHGTPAAYRRHIYRGEVPCDACAVANAADKALRKARRNPSAALAAEQAQHRAALLAALKGP